MKQRQSRGLMPWILTLLCAVLLTVWVLGSMPAAPKEGAAVAAGTAYLDSAAAKDASAIAETLREREKQRRAELLAQQKKEEYVAELLQVVADLKEALPGVTVVVSSILPAQDPAFEKSSKWRNIPEWSEAVGAACAENGIPFADNTEICQTYADLWQPDGIHVRPEFYPYWAANLILAGLDSPAEAEDATNETENDPA